MTGAAGAAVAAAAIAAALAEADAACPFRPLAAERIVAGRGELASIRTAHKGFKQTVSELYQCDITGTASVSSICLCRRVLVSPSVRRVHDHLVAPASVLGQTADCQQAARRRDTGETRAREDEDSAEEQRMHHRITHP